MSKPRTQPATIIKDSLQLDDNITEIRLKLLQLAHVPGRQASQTIEIATGLEEYVLRGKPQGPQ